MPLFFVLISVISFLTAFAPADTGHAEVTLNEPVPEMLPAPSVPAKTDSVIAGAFLELRAGNFDGGLSILRNALKGDPDSRELRSALAEGLNAAAVNAYDKGDFRRARDLLFEAVGLSRKMKYSQNLARVELRLDDAKGALETLEPYASDPEIKKDLKGIYIRLGNESRDVDLKDAVEYYGKALELDPADLPLKEALAKLRSEYDAEASMRSAKTGHFLVKFDGEENAVVANVVVLLLEEAYVKVGEDLDYYPSGGVEVLLYSKERFRDITRSPSWAGAIYDGRIKIPVGGITEKTGALERTIFHEYTHAVVHGLSKGRAPTWLNEGIAQYEDGRDVSLYRGWLREMAMGGKIELRSLEGSFMGLSAQDSEKAYVISLSATDYIIREYGSRAVKRIFVGLADGLTLDQSIYSALGLSYAEFEESWLDSLKK